MKRRSSLLFFDFIYEQYELNEQYELAISSFFIIILCYEIGNRKCEPAECPKHKQHPRRCIFSGYIFPSELNVEFSNHYKNGAVLKSLMSRENETRLQ